MTSDPKPTNTWRWPIRVQLLLPMIAVVLMAAILGTAMTAYWIAARVRREQDDALSRVVRTLADSTFPLTENVLSQMRGLSGAEFILLSKDAEVLEATLSNAALAATKLDEAASAAAKVPSVKLDDRHFLFDFVTLSIRPGVPDDSTLFVLYPEDELTSRIYGAIYPAVLSAAGATAAALLVATWLARRLVRPIPRLVEQSASIANGDFRPMRLPNRNDELRDLAESINQMALRLADYGDQVRQNERMRTLGQIGAAMAHQLRNAATGGRMAVELHQRACTGGETDESLNVALRQFRLMESYLRQFLAVGRHDSSARTIQSIPEIVERSLAMVRPMAIHAGIELASVYPSSPITILGEPESLEQLVSNLLINAVEAAMTDTKGPARVAVEICSNGKFGCIRIRDSGPGPASAVRDSLFDAFVTGKPDGVGLGLFVAKVIAASHGGILQWEREDEQTTFSFEFPHSNGTVDGAHIDRR